MKIDGNRPSHDAQATDGTRRSGKDGGVRQGHGIGPATSSGDRVELSGDAALRASALKAALDAPAIRTELVEQMKQKLNAGKIGQDAGALADAMLDDQIK